MCGTGAGIPADVTSDRVGERLVRWSLRRVRNFHRAVTVPYGRSIAHSDGEMWAHGFIIPEQTVGLHAPARSGVPSDMAERHSQRLGDEEDDGENLSSASWGAPVLTGLR